MISKVQWNMEGQNRSVWVGDDKHEYTIKSDNNVLNNEVKCRLLRFSSYYGV